MSGQIGSNSEDDVDFVPLTNVEEIQSVSNTLDEHQNTGRKRTSRAWDHFTRQEIDGQIKAVCNHCGRKLVGGSTAGTTHLNTHVKRCPVRKAQLAANPTTSPSIPFNFDPDLARIKLAQMIVKHEYPLSMVEHSGFIEYSSTLCPTFQMVSRNTIRSDIMKMYKAEKEKCRQSLEKSRSRIAITSDMWTANHQKRGYMTVTAHFIDDSWTLHNQILSFKYVPCPHDAPALLEALRSCLNEWKIEDKISTVTLDNCSANDSMIDLFKGQFEPDSFILKGKLLHVRCCAHILNLIVKDGLSVIGDSVDKIRDSVAYWSGTPKRHEKFEDTARQLGVPYTKKISLDCVTRWNSTFLMLSTALSYKTVFERARLRELRLRCAPSEIDWQNAQQLCDKLEVFHEVTELFSGTKYPTANIFFPKICEIKTNIDSWMSSDVPFIKDMATQMMSKFQKYWKEIHGLMCVAVVLDPRYKFMLLEYYFPVIYGDEQYVTQITNIRELCCELLEEYGSKFPDLRERRVQVDNVSSSSTRRMDALSNFDRYVRASYRVENMKSELDLYLEENLVPRTEESFDICNYWKVTGLKYPLLSMIAKDVFAVPVSTVASESSFSTGGRHVSPHRSRLHPSTLEALVCTQNWLMTDKKGKYH
ncbi:hypothetical protein CsatB_000962 [Cannabis sativa]